MLSQDMNKRVSITVVIGILSLVLLFLSKLSVVFGWLSSSLSLLGAFLGIWFTFSFLFKSLSLSKKEKIYLLLGMFLALISFALGRYGMMLLYWLPAMVFGSIFYRVLGVVINKTFKLVNNPLNDKIKEMEEQKRRQDNQIQ